jgi:putative transposase
MEMEGKNDGHRKRCKRWNIAGHGHYLTFSCFRRRPFLMKEQARWWLAEAIRAARDKHDFRLIAWMFMPAHAHVLIWPQRREYSVSAMLSSMKLPVTIKAKGFVMKHAPGFLAQMLDEQPNGKRAYRFWQRGGGYDRNVFTAEELWEKIDYIHSNPVRRKLVVRAVEWEWSSAADYAKVRVGRPPLEVENRDLPWVTG